MKRGKNNKKKSPSRDRYDKENPTVSGRMPKEKRDKFYANLAKSGRTVSDALNSLANELELKVIPIDEVRQQIFDEGMEYGMEAIDDLYAVKYPCSKCGKEMVVTDENEKKAIRDFMIENGWHHGDCDHSGS
jgi:hypothetical protein